MREYVLSNEEAKKVDDYTIKKLGFPGKQLMQSAGDFVTWKCKLFLKHVPGSRVDIFVVLEIMVVTDLLWQRI